MEKQLTFTIEERGPENEKGHKAKVLIDSEGYICGIFSSYPEAEKAAPVILRNIQAGRANLKYAKLELVRPGFKKQFNRR